MQEDIFKLVDKYPAKKKEVGELYCVSKEQGFNAIRLRLEYPNRGKWKKNESGLLQKFQELDKKYPEMIIHEVTTLPSRLVPLLKKLHIL